MSDTAAAALARFDLDSRHERLSLARWLVSKRADDAGEAVVQMALTGGNMTLHHVERFRILLLAAVRLNHGAAPEAVR